MSSAQTNEGGASNLALAPPSPSPVREDTNQEEVSLPKQGASSRSRESRSTRSTRDHTSDDALASGSDGHDRRESSHESQRRRQPTPTATDVAGLVADVPYSNEPSALSAADPDVFHDGAAASVNTPSALPLPAATVRSPPAAAATTASLLEDYPTYRNAQRPPRRSFSREPGINHSTLDRSSGGGGSPSTGLGYLAEDGGGAAVVPSYGGLHPPRAASSAAASEMGRSPNRHVEIRGMLITAERELAQVREECARRGMALDTQREALTRERASVAALRARHAADLDAVTEEHEAQVRQLRDQLRVLKTVSESAMAEKAKATEEAAQRKRELLALLDSEREEKRLLMADYRTQTESLIAEQGKEITTLHAALERIKAEYDALLDEHKTLEDAADERAGDVEALKVQLDRERLEAARRLKDVQTSLSEDKEALQEQLNVLREEQLRERAQQSARLQAVEEQLRNAQSRLQVQEEAHQRALESCRQASRRSVEEVQHELQAAKEQRSRAAEEQTRELERAIRNEQSAAEVLRAAVEQERKEKEQVITDGFRQREELQLQHRQRLQQVAQAAEDASKALAQERTARKEAETAREVLQVRVEALQESIESLNKEIDANKKEQRARERATMEAHEQLVEELRTKHRVAVTDLAAAQQHTRQLTLTVQRLQDDVAAKSTALEVASKELKRIEEEGAAALAKQAEAAASTEAALEHEYERLRHEKLDLERENHRLTRSVGELEARGGAAEAQLEAERTALATATRQLQDATRLADDLRQALSHAQHRSEQLAEEKTRLETATSEAALVSMEREALVQAEQRKAEEVQREMTQREKAHAAQLAELAQRHKAEIAALRLSADQLRGDVNRSRDALLAKDAALQQLREELGQLHREYALREGGLEEALEDLREAHERELHEMDEVLNSVRSDLAKAQAMRTQYQRELSQVHREAERQRADLEDALARAEAVRAKLQEDARYRESLNEELQSTVRLLTVRLGSFEEDVRRLHEDLADTAVRLNDAHTLIGRKDAALGQLTARLRAHESRTGIL